METFKDLRDDIEKYEDEEYSHPEASDVVSYAVYSLIQGEDDFEEDEHLCDFPSYKRAKEYASLYAKNHNCRTHIVICPADEEYEDSGEGRDWWETYADGHEPYEVIWESGRV